MKVKFLIVAMSLLLIQGCIFQKAKELETKNAKLEEQVKLQEESIKMYVTSINDIYHGLQQLREGTDTVSVKAEAYNEYKSTNKNQLKTIKDNVNELNQELKDYRSKNNDLLKKIAELERVIGSNSRNNAELGKNIDELSKKNAELGKSIEELNKNNEELSKNNEKLLKDNSALADLLATFKQEAENSSIKITELTTKVTGLETRIEEQQKELAEKSKAIEEQNKVITKQNETITEKESVIQEQLTTINTLYYIAGSQDVLAKQGIIKTSGGFLSKKVFEFSGSFTLDSFNTINVKEQSAIQCENKILKVIPTLPADSFEINGSELKILNSDIFCLYKVLVIITDKKR